MEVKGDLASIISGNVLVMLLNDCSVVLIETVDDLVGCQVGLGIFQDNCIDKVFVPESNCAIDLVESTGVDTNDTPDSGDGVEDLSHW